MTSPEPLSGPPFGVGKPHQCRQSQLAAGGGKPVTELELLRANRCPFPGCQLSLGHPLPHCVIGRPDSPESPKPYLMIDGDGKVLRVV
jgi:hypothetical protein